MKICLIGINFPPELTGCAPYTADLALMLSEAGHEIEIITGFPHYPEWSVPKNFRGKLRCEEIYSGMRLTRLWHYVPKTDSLIGRALYELTFGIHLRFNVSRRRPDLVLVVSPSLLSMYSAIYLKKLGANSRVLVQDVFSSAIKQAGYRSSNFIKALITSLESYLLQQMDGVAVVSESFIEKLTELGVPLSKIQISSNYILPDLLTNNDSGDKEKWGWNFDKKIVLYTGNLGKKQDLGNLLDASKIVHQKSDNVFFSLFGSGNQKEVLISRSQNLPNLEIRNLVPNQDYMTLLRSSDLLIVHESSEIANMSISSKLTSYRASGTPILVVCSVFSPTYFEAKQFGLDHCDAGDPTLLAERIIESIKFSGQKRTESDTEYLLRKKRLVWSLTND